MTLAFALAAFFLVLGLFRDGNEEPFFAAGIAASAVLVAAVIVRRAIISKHQLRHKAARQLESNLLALRVAGPTNEKKLTIEKNASILKELKRKSEAATVLGKYAEGHREVFQLCGQYLEINERELRTVNPGSPRIAVLRKGREIAEEYYRRHMLKWAEIETTSLLENAQAATKSTLKVELAGKALAVIDSAAAKYPTDRKLRDSAGAIEDFIVKVKVKDLVERAAKAESKGNVKLATKHLKGALSELERGSDSSGDRASAMEKINVELERLSNSELQ
jgi:hypothetical protein